MLVQKNGSDAEMNCRNRAEFEIGYEEKKGTDAETCADLMQMNLQNFVQIAVQIHFADSCAEAGAAPAGRPVYRGCGAYSPVAPAERPIPGFFIGRPA